MSRNETRHELLRNITSPFAGRKAIKYTNEIQRFVFMNGASLFTKIIPSSTPYDINEPNIVDKKRRGKRKINIEQNFENKNKQKVLRKIKKRR